MTCVWVFVSAVAIMLSSTNSSIALAFAPIGGCISTRSTSTTTVAAPRRAEEGGSSSTSSVVNQVTGEELEMMMQDWEQPLVVDAYATVSSSCICRFLQ